MSYNTMYNSASRVSPERNLSLPLRENSVFEELFPWGIFIFSDHILGSAGPGGFYRIDLRTLELNRLRIENANPQGRFIYASEERAIVKRREGTFFSFDPKTSVSSEIEICQRVGTFSQAVICEHILFTSATSERKTSLVALDYDLAIVCEIPLDFFMQGFAVNESNDRVAVIGTDGDIVGIDFRNKKEIWRVGLNNLGVIQSSSDLTAVKSYVHIFGNIAVAGYANLYLVALELDSGELVWKQQLKGSVNYPCVDWRGRVYKVSRNELIVLDARTGEFLKQEPVVVPESLNKEGLDLSTAFCDVTDTHFFGITPKGLLFAVNLESAELDWYDDRQEMHRMGSPFVIDRNRLYLQTTTSNKLVVYEGEGGFKP